jgi:hypothetical protein
MAAARTGNVLAVGWNERGGSTTQALRKPSVVGGDQRSFRGGNDRRTSIHDSR